jgi:hypothetical protein
MADPSGTQQAIRALPNSASAKTFADILTNYAKQGVQAQDVGVTDNSLNQVCNELYSYAANLRGRVRAGAGEVIISRPSEDFNKIIALLGKYFGALGALQSKIQIENAATDEAIDVAKTTALEFPAKIINSVTETVGKAAGNIISGSGIKWILGGVVLIVAIILVFKFTRKS